MPYLCICKDQPDSESLRKQFTPAHLAYIESTMDQIMLAGPLRESVDEIYNASCFIYLTDSREQALQLLHNDPYYKAGIYASVDCQEFIPAAGSLIGGKTW